MASAASGTGGAEGGVDAGCVKDVPGKSKIRWAIVGTAKVARKVHTGMKEHGELVAVASRSQASADAFASDLGIPHAFGSYEALAERADLYDCVYLPIPCALHAEWVRVFAKLGKHILCEKPVGKNAAEVADMIRVCRENGVQFMDGVFFMHHQRFKGVIDALASGSIGTPRRINSAFSFPGNPDFWENNIRVNGDLEPLAALGDLGWYCVRIAIAVFGGPPEAVETTHYVEKDGVPIEAGVSLFWPGGRVASFDVAYTMGFRQWAEVVGSEKSLFIPEFVVPSSDTCKFEVRTRSDSVATESTCVQHQEMVKAFNDIVASRVSGDPVPGEMPDESWAQLTLLTQAVVDACLASGRAGCVKQHFVAPAEWK